MLSTEFTKTKQFSSSPRQVLAGPVLCLACSTAFAQFTFTEKSGTPFAGVDDSSIAFADVNKDGHPDVLITGWLGGSESIAKLYLNDGSGNFVERATPFAEVYNSSIAFADVNKDGHQDVLITGWTGSKRIAKLYLNDGESSFTEKMEMPFPGVNAGSIAFADVNKDGHQDVLITGYDGGKGNAKLYLNDGSGNFAEKTTGTSFTGINSSSVAFSDVDKDGDEDVLITGVDSGSGYTSKLYINDGSGNFAEKKMGASFTGVWDGSVAFSDVDKDGYEDVLITGIASGREYTSKLYINDGSGNFAEKKMGASFTGVWDGSVAFSDVDNDGDEDVLITGRNTIDTRITELYINDGDGDFTKKMTGVPFAAVNASSIASADVDKDGDEDVLITGIASGREYTSKLYINNVNNQEDEKGVFTEKEGTSFTGVVSGSIAFADVDKDGNEDVLITGQNSDREIISELYINDGAGGFTKKTERVFISGVTRGSVAFSDVDKDGDEDVLITGTRAGASGFSQLYLNEGNSSGNFIRKGGPFTYVYESSIAFSDVDKDGDEDVLITGNRGDSRAASSFAKLYVNNGDGNFTEKEGTSFTGVISSSIAFSDVDKDGDEDVLITGDMGIAERVSKLYINHQLPIFTSKSSVSVPGGHHYKHYAADRDGHRCRQRNNHLFAQWRIGYGQV